MHLQSAAWTSGGKSAGPWYSLQSHLPAGLPGLTDTGSQGSQRNEQRQAQPLEAEAQTHSFFLLLHSIATVRHTSSSDS